MTHHFTKLVLGIAILAAGQCASAQLSQAEIAEAQKWLNVFSRGGGGEWISITIPEVQSSLNLSAQQQSQVDKLLAEFLDEMLANIQNPSTMKSKTEATKTAYRSRLDGVLTPQQATRYREVNIQLLGMSAVLLPDVQAAIGLSNKERADVSRVYSSHHAELWNSYGEIMGTPVPQLRALLEKPQSALDQDLAKALTSQHRSALSKLGGLKIALPSSTPIYRALRAYRLP
jgi:hypothetical protein